MISAVFWKFSGIFLKSWSRRSALQKAAKLSDRRIFSKFPQLVSTNFRERAKTIILFLLDDEEKWKELETAFEDFNLTQFQADNLNKVRFNFTIIKQACHRNKVPLFTGCTDALNECYLFFSY